MRYRHRLRSNGKRTRHIYSKKSSESNPSVTQHRERARARRFVHKMPFVPVDEAYNKVVSQQEDAVIKQLPMHSLQIDDISGQKDARSSTCGRSEVKSHLSVFTNCTNPTFASVHNIWKRGSLLQQEVLAVLAAVAELIKDRGGKESDAEYFAALLTAIETIPATDESRLEAAFYLLRLVIKKLDEGVVRLCFSKAFQIFMKKLSETSPGPTLAKLICTLGDILRQQPAGIWENNNTRLSLMKIEMFALHEKSVVRSAARRTLCSILNDPMKATSDGYHPSALMVGEFITQHMAQGFGNKKIDMILRLLCLSEDIMHKMPYSIFKKFAEQALTALSISDAVLRCAIFRCFRKVLRQQPDVATLPLSTNILLCSLLRDFKSVASDPDVACFWLQAVCEALVCLTARDFLKSAVPLVSSLQQIFDTFDLGIESVATVACTVICRLVDHCVQQSEELPSYCVDLCNKSLNSQSSAVWRHVLRAEFRIIVVCKDSINEASLIRALIVLDELRKDSNRFIIPEIDLNIGAVVRYIGAEQVLSVLSLDLDSHSLTTIQLRKPWLIPILRVNMCNQSISLALRYFLPLANHLLKKKNSRNEMEKKTALILCKQLWDLLPNLLSSPTDFISQFPVLAKILLKVLVEERDLQLIVLSSIRSALRFALLPDAPAARKDMMSEFAYSFMRILFNLYGVADATKEDVEGITETSIGVLQCSALETIRMYVKLTPSVVIDNFINLAVKSIQLEDVALTRKIRILDLMAALVKKANTSGLNSMFSVIHPWFLTNETALQKKAFRIMEQIMKRSADKNAAEFFSLNDDEISHILDQGLDTIALNARAPLLAVYHCKLLSLTSYEGVQNFKARFLEKIIICLDKSHNIRTRSNALKCFVKLCQQLILFGSSKNETPSNALHSVLNTIFATLNRARKVCSNDDLSSLENARSANIALNIIAQKYVRVMDTPLLSDLIAHACNGIGDGRPAIRVLVIRLMRMLVKKLPNYAMQQYQELIISAVFDGQLTSDVTQKVRKANKLLLEVLIDRIGVEVLITRTNKLSWIKQLKSAAKRRRRISRRNTQAAHSTKTDEESDVPSTVPSVRTAGADTVLDMLSNSGSDGEETDEESVGCRTRGSSIWLKNDNEEDMMDLLDQNKMLKNIATAQPASLKDKRVQKLDKNCDGDCGEFKMTEDGRIIIEDTDMEENNEMIRRRLTGILHFTDKKMKVDGVDSDENEDHDLEHTSMVKSAACHNNKSTKASRCIRPKKSAISRQNRRYEPYAYIPLKQKKKQKVALKTLIKEAVADAKMRKD